MRQRRPGVTLLEVLVAIFIMGIGTLAILVLFPLGALNMSRALKDDRCGAIAPNADFIAQARGMRSDINIVNALSGVLNTPAGYLAPDANKSSYPVIIDAYYCVNSGNTLPYVGPAPTGMTNPVTGVAYANSPVQRIIPSYIATSLDSDRWFSFQDDLLFNTNGLPVNSGGGGLQRQGYYTYAYCLQRAVTSQPNTTDQMTVIVYQGRPVQSPTLEPGFQVVSSTNPPNPPNMNDPGMTLVWPAGSSAPNLRRGNWLMDNTPVVTTSTTGFPRQPKGYAHGRFYKVMDAYLLSSNTMQVEIYPPLLDSGVQQVVVMEYAIEIFTRGTGR